MVQGVAKKLFRCIIMGPPGSGKGTVAGRILDNFDLVHIPAGDFLRREIHQNTHYGKEAKQYINKGHLVPDELVTKIILAELRRHEHSNWLLDGFPRTVRQAEFLQRHYEIHSVLELVVPFEVIIERLKARWIHAPSGRIYNLEFNPPKQEGKDDVTGEPLTQRHDDQPEIVASRLRQYEHWEEPVSKYYRNHQLLQRFEGKTTNKIWPHILEHLRQKIPKEYHLKL